MYNSLYSDNFISHHFKQLCYYFCTKRLGVPRAKIGLMRMHSWKNRGDMVSLQFSSVGEANIGADFILFYYIQLLSCVIRSSVRVIRVLGVCIPGFQVDFSSFIGLFSLFYDIFLSGGFYMFFRVSVGAVVWWIMYSNKHD